MSTRPSHFFEQLAGVPVHYDRPPVAAYGSVGVARKFHCAPALNDQLEVLFQEIFAKAPDSFGAPKIILSAGAYVDKAGQHGLGKSFDLDGVHWAERSFITRQQPNDKIIYLAVQALCHKHFGVVLGFNYNAAHEDHLHLDVGRSVRFRETKSVAFFLQEVLNSLFDTNLGVDGEYGAGTESALRRARQDLGLGPLSQTANWTGFLDHVAEQAFEIAKRQPVPGSAGV